MKMLVGGRDRGSVPRAKKQIHESVWPPPPSQPPPPPHPPTPPPTRRKFVENPPPSASRWQQQPTVAPVMSLSFSGAGAANGGHQTQSPQSAHTHTHIQTCRGHHEWCRAEERYITGSFNKFGPGKRSCALRNYMNVAQKWTTFRTCVEIKFVFKCAIVEPERAQEWWI